MNYQWLVLNRKLVSGAEHYDASDRPILLPTETEETRAVLKEGNMIQNRLAIQTDPVLGNLTRNNHVYRMSIQKRRKMIIDGYIKENLNS